MVMIFVVMNLKEYSETLKKLNINIYISIDLKRRIEEDTVLEKKIKTSTLNVHMKQMHSRSFKGLLDSIKKVKILKI